MTTPQLVSPVEFARLVGADRSRVSRWIGEGKISGEALVGAGRGRRINVELAQAQLASRRDPGQALGNGAKTRLGPRQASPPPAPRPSRVEPPGRSELDTTATDTLADPDDLDADSLDCQVQRARLAKAQADAQERKNAEASGELVAAADVIRRWQGVLNDVRRYLLAVPGRVRETLPELTSAQVAVIDAEVRRALMDAAHGIAPETD